MSRAGSALFRATLRTALSTVEEAREPVPHLEAEMKKLVIAGTLVGAVTLGLPAIMQAAGAQAEKPAAGQTAEKAAKPAKPAKTGSTAAAQGHTAPKTQPTTASDASAPGAMALGSVRVPTGVKANGQDLPGGTYQVRLTADEAKPDAKGSDEALERWVEFVKAGKVVGKEVVSIVPASEIKLVQKDTPPPANGSTVQALKGGDYVRVWINKGGNYYLIHLAK
jgi:hypothetical protein